MGHVYGAAAVKAYSVYFGGQRLITVAAKSGRMARELARIQLIDSRKPGDPSFKVSRLTAKVMLS